MELSQIEILQGIFSLIFVAITFIIAIKIMLKYFEKRNRDFILFGLAWIGLSNPWIPDAITFIMILLTGSPLNPALYFIIGFAFFPVLIYCWMVAFASFVYEDKQKYILIMYAIISIIFEIAFFYLLFTDIDQLGVFKTPFQVEFGLMMIIFLIINGIYALVTGLLFSIRSIKIDNDPEINLRGKLLIVAFLSFSIAVIVDTTLGSFDPVWIFFNRILLMFSGVFFYMGFILPERIKKIFLK